MPKSGGAPRCGSTLTVAAPMVEAGSRHSATLHGASASSPGLTCAVMVMGVSRWLVVQGTWVGATPRPDACAMSGPGGGVAPAGQASIAAGSDPAPTSILRGLARSATGMVRRSTPAS